MGNVISEELERDRALTDEAVHVVDQTVVAETGLRFMRLLLEGLQEVCMLACGLAAVRARRITLGAFVSFTGYLGLWERGIGDVAGLVSDVTRLRYALARYFGLLQGCDEADRIVPAAPWAGNLAVRGVSFAYGDAEVPVLREVTFDVRVGERLAVVGASGSGKSTLLAVLAGLCEPSAGIVALGPDSTSLHDVQRDWLWERLALVAQDARIFDRSIDENVSFHRGNVSRADLLAAAGAAGVLEFAADLPNGLDTTVGEGGCRLSGGQRQRVALARAVLRRPALLLLDEATSQLDARTERAVIENISEHLEASTIVAVTHRIETARWAQRIAVMHRGRLVACGTHDRLLRTCDEYAQLVRASRAAPE